MINLSEKIYQIKQNIIESKNKNEKVLLIKNLKKLQYQMLFYLSKYNEM